VEKRDISEGESTDGSESNPSEDNLDEKDMFKRVYAMGKNKMQEMVEKRNEAQTKFKEDLVD